MPGEFGYDFNMRITLLSFSLIASIVVSGCGKPCTVSGKVISCSNEPVKGSITFSPAEGDADRVSANLGPDGSFSVTLPQEGKYNLTFSPDVDKVMKVGEEYPCDLAAQEKQISAGSSSINLELKPKKK